jgi:hypothetical protein
MYVKPGVVPLHQCKTDWLSDLEVELSGYLLLVIYFELSLVKKS